MRYFGLIGQKLGHSFSKKYFTEKFAREEISGQYELYEIPTIEALPALWASVPLSGMNVTIPYKQQIMAYLDEISPEAAAVGAVNTVLFRDGRKIGYNTDTYGFRVSLQAFLGETKLAQALILGNGGAAKAVRYVLEQQMGFRPCLTVSRSAAGPNQITYQALQDLNLDEYPLIVNTTPLGMFPYEKDAPAIPYDRLGEGHFAYDLIYNPAETEFMRLITQQGAKACNGMEMLILQAEGAWEIWNGIK
ncbi:MAG: shikimate dehydrogenase [Bacteroidota bacterium]